MIIFENANILISVGHEMNEQVACDGTTWIPGLIFYPRTDFTLLAFTFILVLKPQIFFLFNSQLPPTFPPALPTHCTFNVLKELPILEAHTLSQILQMKHTLHICPLA